MGLQFVDIVIHELEIRDFYYVVAIVVLVDLKWRR